MAYDVRPVCEFCAKVGCAGAMVMTYGGWICHICYSTVGVRGAFLGVKS